MGRDRRRARSARSISITQRRDVVVVVVPSTAQRHDFVIFKGVACFVYKCVCGRARASWASVYVIIFTRGHVDRIEKRYRVWF